MKIHLSTVVATTLLLVGSTHASSAPEVTKSSTYLDGTPRFESSVGHPEPGVQRHRSYYPNGQMQAEMHFNAAGWEAGLSTWWTDSGEELFSHVYSADANGQVVIFNKELSVSMVVTMEDGVPNGPSISFFKSLTEDPDYIIIRNYKSGEFHGCYRTVAEGQVIERGAWLDGSRYVFTDTNASELSTWPEAVKNFDCLQS